MFVQTQTLANDMSDHFKKNLLIAYDIIGGIIIIFLMLLLLFSKYDTATNFNKMTIILLFFYGVALVGLGVQLRKGKLNTMLHYILYFPQILVWMSDSFTYILSSGISLYIRFFSGKTGFYFNLGPEYSFSIDTVVEREGFGINVTAILILILIAKVKESFEEEEEEELVEY